MAFSIAVCSGRDLFAITGITMFRYIEVLFHIVYYCWGIKKWVVMPRTSLQRGLLYRGSIVFYFMASCNNNISFNKKQICRNPCSLFWQFHDQQRRKLYHTLLGHGTKVETSI